MIENRNVDIVTDSGGKKLVLIKDIRFKGKRQVKWEEVEEYLKGYMGDCYEILDTAEKYILGMNFQRSFVFRTVEQHSWEGRRKQRQMRQQLYRS